MFWVGRYDDLVTRKDILTKLFFRKAGTPEHEKAFPAIGMSQTEKIRMRLKKCGVAAEEIETRLTQITDLAREQLSDQWNEREKGMSLDQAVALRADELGEMVLTRLELRLAAIQKDMEEMRGV
jgi:hypothetical protein